ncbi:MAG: hypothetical protein ACRDGG_01790 [Anaerolineae bacterium]
MIPLDSIVGELHIVNGQRQTTTPRSGVFTAPRRGARGRRDDTLFILVDAAGSHPIIPDLIQRIQQAYWRVPGSVTSGLRAALDAGNDWLIDYNQSAVAPTRAGITCAVLRGSEVFIAQVGSACAYVAHQGRLERFPLRDVSGGSLPPLGVARAIEVRFSHADLHPGDVLLLSDASFATRAPEETIVSSIVYVGVETALNNLEHLIGNQSLTAMVIEVGAAAPVAEARVESPKPAAHGERAQSPEATALRPDLKIGEWAGAIGSGVSRGAGSLGTAARALFQRTLPDRTKRPATAAGHARRRAPPVERNTPLMAVLAIGIPIVVAILVTAVYLERSTAAQIDTLLSEARQLIADADGSSSVDVKRERWLAALAKADEAISLAPENAAAIDIRTQAQAQLDRLDGTLRVSPILLYDFKKVGRHRLATQGVSLFVLDQAEGRVDRLTLEGEGIAGQEPAPAVAKGITVDGRTVGDLIDLVWVAAGGERQKSALIVLERGGLIEYDLAFGPTVIPFADSTVPAGARRLDTFEGNLYLLDTAARQVWRYRPSGNGYSGLPDGYFETPLAEIENAIDMAIDGRVYLLEENGTLHKYFGGSPAEPFGLTGVPEPIGQAVAVAVDPNVPNESSLYVADLDGARILHFAPDGRFIRQMRAVGGEFDAIEDLLVDERAGRLYVISAGRLYAATLPAATAP